MQTMTRATHLIAGTARDSRLTAVNTDRLDQSAINQARRHGDADPDDAISLAEAILETDEFVKDRLSRNSRPSSFYAVVNKTLDEQGQHADAELAPVSEDYNLIKANTTLAALAEAVQTMGVENGLSGVMRKFKRKGAQMDLYFDHDLMQYDIDGISGTITAGLSVWWKHDGSSTITARPFFRFDESGGIVRALYDDDGNRIEHKLYHRGNMTTEDAKQNLFEGFLEMLYYLGALRDHVIGPIEESKNTKVNPSDYDFSNHDTEHDLNITELYRGMGVPARLAEAATVKAAHLAGHLSTVTQAKAADSTSRKKLIRQLSDDKTYRAVHLVDALVWTLENVSTAQITGSTRDKYQRQARRGVRSSRNCLAMSVILGKLPEFSNRASAQRKITSPPYEIAWQSGSCGLQMSVPSVHSLRRQFSAVFYI